MQRVLVIDSNKKPLMPCHPARARQLLKEGKAAVYRCYPFTIILHERNDGYTQPISFKFDPGSRKTGIAIVADFQQGKRLIWAAVLEHRGEQIKNSLLVRHQLRRSRRSRHTRYRPAHINNRLRPKNWLPPSLQSRIDNLLTWLKRLANYAPVTDLSMELVKFNTQLLQNAEIKGLEYQQGELAGYEVREYLLEKWGRKCVYCAKENTSLEIEHIVPKARGGSDRVSNLTLACHACNQRKGVQTAAEFGYPEVQKQAKQSMQHESVVNVTRWALYSVLQTTGLVVEIGSGGRTKFNRIKQVYPKAHWIDAACVGESGADVYIDLNHVPLLIKATGHGSRQICRTNKYGFPTRYRLRQKRHFGFQTGDIVQAVISSGKYAGKHVGRIACRANGRFDVKTGMTTITTHYSNCSIIHHSDGYIYLLIKEVGAIPSYQ